MFVSLFCAVSPLLFLLLSQNAAVGYQTPTIHGCSQSEVQSVQRHWAWLMHSTTMSEKVALYEAVMAYIAAGHATVGDDIVNIYTPPDEIPIELRAYKMFSDYEIQMNAYTSPEVYASHVRHLILTFPTVMKMVSDNMELIADTSVNVIGSLIAADEKVTWTICYENMVSLYKDIYANYKFQASCDVTADSGDPDHPIAGQINFTQPASGGLTTVDVQLNGFAEPNRKHAMHVHEAGSTEERCLQAGAHFNPHNNQHGGPLDTDRHVGDLGNLVTSRDSTVWATFHDHQISLFGPNNIIGKTLVIHEMEDDLGRGGFADSKTVGHAGARLACCVIYQTYS